MLAIPSVPSVHSVPAIALDMQAMLVICPPAVSVTLSSKSSISQC